MLLTENNIMAELSYAYLHAIASRAGFGCQEGTRHEDGIGVDAKLRVKERFGPDSILTNFSTDIQLKSIKSDPVDVNGKYAYKLKVKNYNDLRAEGCGSSQLLIVLFLPPDNTQWLVHSVEQLICRRCAYWLSLVGAPPSQNKATQTVYIPKNNSLSVENLRRLMTRFSRRETIRYEP